MINPKQYCKGNGLQRRDAGDVISKYIHLIRWRAAGGDDILDIGCGSGDVLWELLRPVLPESYGSLMGSDVSDAMVTHAATQYVHPKVDFMKLDISLTTIPDNFRQKFDHIFSFYCLHWIQDQRQAMRNIFDLLKPGGDILVTFLASNPIFEIYLIMSKMSKWKSYMMDVHKFVTPYQHVENVQVVLEERLESIGFQVTMCECKHMVYEYENLNIVQNAMVSVNPFMARLPDHMKNQFIFDYMTELKHMKLVEENNNVKSEKIVMPYRLIVICASKPSIT